MAQYRMQVTRRVSTAPDAKDNVVNTFYLDTDGAPITSDDPEALAEDACEVFANRINNVAPFDRVTCRAYNMSHPEPRLPVGEHTIEVIPGTQSGPREVALCLSYYAGRNVPRRRGRMFIGPFPNSMMGERPSASVRGMLGGLAADISGLGGVNVQWVHYSPTTRTFATVTNWWVDDEWDTIRSRGPRATERLQGTVSG